jgi:hypothetical protein
VVASVLYTAAVTEYQWENYYRLVDWTSEPRQADNFRRLGLEEQAHENILGSLNDRRESFLERRVAWQNAHLIRMAELAAAEPDAGVKAVYNYLFMDHLAHRRVLADKLSRTEGLSPLAQPEFTPMEGRPLDDQFIEMSDVVKNPYDRRTASTTTKIGVRMVLAQELALRDGYRSVMPYNMDAHLQRIYQRLALVDQRHIAMVHSLLNPLETPLEFAYLGEAAQIATLRLALKVEAPAAVRQAFVQMLSDHQRHAETLAQLIQEDEGRSVEDFAQPVSEPARVKAIDRFVAEIVEEQKNVKAQGDSFKEAA